MRGRWHHGVTGRLYVDGTLVASDTFAAPQNISNPFYIGQYPGGGFGWFGLLDEVRLYNRALTAAEINTIFSN